MGAVYKVKSIAFHLCLKNYNIHLFIPRYESHPEGADAD